MEQPDTVLVLTTWPADTDPAGMAHALVEERLAACVNLLPPMESVYRWEGAVERASERQVLVKTTRQALGALMDRIRSLHPYGVPELLVLPVESGEEAYLEWVRASTGRA
jgi:periplasmic divalent cation tolerance protein